MIDIREDARRMRCIDRSIWRSSRLKCNMPIGCCALMCFWMKAEKQAWCSRESPSDPSPLLLACGGISKPPPTRKMRLATNRESGEKNKSITSGKQQQQARKGRGVRVSATQWAAHSPGGCRNFRSKSGPWRSSVPLISYKMSALEQIQLQSRSSSRSTTTQTYSASTHISNCYGFRIAIHLQLRRRSHQYFTIIVSYFLFFCTKFIPIYVSWIHLKIWLHF